MRGVKEESNVSRVSSQVRNRLKALEKYLVELDTKLRSMHVSPGSKNLFKRFGVHGMINVSMVPVHIPPLLDRANFYLKDHCCAAS